MLSIPTNAAEETTVKKRNCSQWDSVSLRRFSWVAGEQRLLARSPVLKAALPPAAAQKFWVTHKSPLTRHFTRALRDLPEDYTRSSRLEYRQLINTYGTHCVSQLQLGGRVQDVTAVRVCEAALDWVTADEVKDCLSLEAPVSIGAGKGRAQAAFSQCEEQKKKQNFKQSFHKTYSEHHTEVSDRHSHSDLMFSEGQNGKRSAHDFYCCVCPGDGSINTMRCSWGQGQGKLAVTVEWASSLWGDCSSPTDAYVKGLLPGPGASEGNRVERQQPSLGHSPRPGAPMGGGDQPAPPPAQQLGAAVGHGHDGVRGVRGAGRVRRLPLAAVDWRVRVSCQRKLSSSVQQSAMGMMKSAASVVRNDWKVGLKVSMVPMVNVQVGLAGSRSKLAEFVTQKSRKDKYAFIRHEVSCQYYGFGISGKPPLTGHFVLAVKNLPSLYNKASQLEYHHLIHTYGTHYVTQASLGGRVRDVTAVQVCQAALDGLTVNEIKDCLSMEVAVNTGVGSDQSSFNSCKENKRVKFQQSFHKTYRERYVEEEGGQNTDDLFFSKNYVGVFSDWVKTLKSLPGLLTYSLRPIHTLLGQDDPKQEALRQAVSEYIRERALWMDCTKSCPAGTRRSVLDPCSCVCPGNSSTNTMCCSRERGLARLTVTVDYSRERGLARLTVTVERASDLRGDTLTATDAYVKIFFDRRESRTVTIWNRKSPVWTSHMDFGSVRVTDASQLRVEVGDEDNGWDDDLLGACNIPLKSGGPHHRECYLKRGHLRFHYSLPCGPNLRGQRCSEYVPQPPQHSIAKGKGPFW
ncbi:Perforin-1 [Chelonia mydas]|uniref:Perforin-1 n=1 Tax=Chelonia mydas TaxID=8469 RepID=M7CL17_CHEMY|nr:Perforin-1 [Chelonia mydas]